MKADPYDLKTVFGFERQLFAPLFQRPYVWTEKDQWKPLWEDVKRVTEELLAGNANGKPHFLGAVVLDQMRVPLGKPDARSIIDGQQRLTTLQLLMETVRDLCRDRIELDLLRRRIEKLVENQDVGHPDDRFKVWPTNVDRAVYRAIMETPCPKTLRARMKEEFPDDRRRLAEAYEYFYEIIGDWLALDKEGAVERCTALVNAIRDKLRIVVIDMDDQDDAQVIFETLNARGTPLLPSDLVKNFLFHKAQEAGEDVDRLYATYWEPFDGQDSFWRAQIGVGRVKRARIDVFLQHFLSLQKCNEVAIGELFREYQGFYEKHKDKSVEWHLSTFCRYAKHFRKFSELPGDCREGLFFKRLARMQVTTVFPFLLGLYDATTSDKERLPILFDLESFLVRRMLCRLTTQGYNRLFLELVADQVQQNGYTHEGVRKFLLSQKAGSAVWPDDDMLLDACLNEPLYTGITRPRLRMILRAIDSAMHGKNTESYHLKSGLTVEHILPQHWEAHWPLMNIAGESPEQFAERKRRRGQLLHTIGNLTLLTKSMNPHLSNGPFDKKKDEMLRHSAINLNRILVDESGWDEERIETRAKRLFQVLRKVWPYSATTNPKS